MLLIIKDALSSFWFTNLLFYRICCNSKSHWQLQDKRQSRKHYVLIDNYILPHKLLDILAAIPDGEGNQNNDDSDIDDVKFDNHIDMVFNDERDKWTKDTLLIMWISEKLPSNAIWLATLAKWAVHVALLWYNFIHNYPDIPIISIIDNSNENNDFDFMKKVENDT